MTRVALRSVRTHIGQFLLTVLAVVLGVTFLSGTLALRGVLSDTFSALTSSTMTADLYVTGQPIRGQSNNDGSIMTERIDASLAETIAGVDGVESAHPYSSAPATLVGADDTPVTSTGAPTMVLPFYSGEPGRTIVAGTAPTGRDQIVLESDALKRSGLSVGDTTHLVLNGVPTEVRVVGEFTYGTSMAGATIVGIDPTWFMEGTAAGSASAAGAADAVGSAGPKVTSIAVYLADGADAAAVRHQISTLLPDGARLQTRAERLDEQNEYIESILGYVQTFLLVFVVLAMFVGSFIIMNTFAMSVRQRQKEFALLRAVGASPTSVFATVLLQAVVVGLAGSLIGVAGGAGLTRLLVIGLEAYGMPLPGGVPVTVGVVAVSIVVGLLVTIIGALLPARDAALTPPVEAMRGTSGAREKPLRLRGTLGMLMAAAGLAGAIAAWVRADLPHRSAVLGIGAGALVLGLLVASPVLARRTIAVLAIPLRLVRPVGRLAARNLAAAPRRTAATSAALVVGMALVCAGAIIASSMRASISDIVNDSMHADLMVRTPVNSTQLVPLPADMTERIGELDGVEATTGYTAYTDTVTKPDGSEDTGYVVAVDPQRYPEFYDPNVTAGSFDSLDATHVAAFANSGLQLGDEVTVTGPTGSVTATVSAIADSKGIVGTLYTTPQLAAAVGSWSTRTTGDPEQVLASPLGVFVHVRDGADIDAVKSEIQRIIAPTYVFEVVDAGELSDQVGQRADTMLAVLYALLGLSLVIAVLGIVNTLVLSVSERTREIGLMRAVGLGRAQVSGEIICESVLTAVYGTVLGGGIGVLLAGALRSVLADQGLARLVIPWSQLAVMLASAIVVGVLAALWPAARAVRLPVLEAIASE
ncbi:ABC transporter permease [uncultured Actinomyces sp.]|uniref:ABC transporter permease n=1 Tax=uncultured Actinomyces sp. TaxID=249061 RepID=UPI0028EA25C5|nr:ABC transporter permease [uncultured Actinomyces sp.]